MTETKKLLGVLGALIVLVIGVSIFSQLQTYTGTGAPAFSDNAMTPPPYTDAVKAQLAESKGFQYLVSYTGRGFEPNTVIVKKGETVRWTNNSSEDLWISSTGAGGAVYPGTGKECGQSAFDSCRVIGRGAFWEFTFLRSGTWSYQNNRDTQMTGTIEVQ